MTYIKKEWESNVTPLSAENMNNIENGIESLSIQLEENIGATRFSIASNITSAQYPVAYGYYDASTKTVRIYFAARYAPATEQEKQAISSGATHFTIPEAYRPTTASPVLILAYGENNLPAVGAQSITTNGIISQGLVGYCYGIVGCGEYTIE